MIYTCTLNPSVDYVIQLENMSLGELNRAKNEEYFPGGKGINVSIVLNNLNIKSNLLGFIGGFTGYYIKEELKRFKNIHSKFTEIKNNTRINIKIKGIEETEINTSGPNIIKGELKDLMNNIKKIKKDDVLILSGSIPPSIEEDIYHDIAEIINKNEALLVVDSTKEKLLTTLEFKPFLIKPNKYELEELFDVKISNESEIIKYAKILHTKGAQNVLISLGGDGAILITDKEVYRARIPNGNVINTVGSGDSMVAGFVSEYFKTKSSELALKVATACGTATAYSVGLANIEDINSLIEHIKIEIVKGE